MNPMGCLSLCFISLILTNCNAIYQQFLPMSLSIHLALELIIPDFLLLTKTRISSKVKQGEVIHHLMNLNLSLGLFSDSGLSCASMWQYQLIPQQSSTLP
jgi:predicted membrane metal-binding protein